MKAVCNVAKPAPPPHTFDLIGLTEEEAGAILCVCSKIGGCPTNSPHKVFDSVSRALKSAGAVEAYHLTDKSGSAIYFKESKK